MRVRELSIPGVLVLSPERFEDERGRFSETYNEARFRALGLPTGWVQENQSLSRRAGTLRGLHFQQPPAAQAKLGRVAAGAVRDVVVDIRRGSPHHGCWVSAEISADDGDQMLVPAGVAHGFVTLVPDTVVCYLASAHYSAAHDRAVRFDDPALGIDWGLDAAPLLSPKDAAAPPLADSDNLFRYDAATGEPRP